MAGVAAARAWSREELDFAADLWRREGRSAGEIAAALLKAFGVRRSPETVASIAAQNRALFPARGAAHFAAAAMLGRRAARAADPFAARTDAAGFAPPVLREDARAYDAASLRLPLAELSPAQCRFPVNEAGAGETHLFCGRAADAGQRYCGHHRARASGGFWCARTG